MDFLRDMVTRHKAGQAVGVYSLCSAHPLVLQAALALSREHDTPVLIEATCNQVNQDGGYTGMRAADFVALTHELAQRFGLTDADVLLGGDHLGPNPWQHEPAARAMERAQVLVDSYVRAGFRKIHLDCSMACADDPLALEPLEIAARAAQLARVAEDAWNSVGGPAPAYIIGTEVPTPGGATETIETLQVTRAEDVAVTLDAHRLAFGRVGANGAWDRVVGLVVQPGVEFGHDNVVDFVPASAQALSASIESVPGAVFEAHSTDYQTPGALSQLVRQHFAILKVGPAATFALREAYWALSEIEDILVSSDTRSNLRAVMLQAMHADPRHWNRHYRDTSRAAFQMQFSLSDRIRYYWTVPDVQRALRQMAVNLERSPIPDALLSQYLPRQFEAIRAGELTRGVDDLVCAAVKMSLLPYLGACAPELSSLN